MDAAARAMQNAKGDPDVLSVAWANHVRALERRNRINVAWVVTLGACCVATMLLGVVLLLLYVTLTHTGRLIEPHFTLVLDTMDSTGVTMTESLENVRLATESGAQLTRRTVPQLVQLVYSLVRIVTRVEAILQHPQVQLALLGNRANDAAAAH